MSYKEYREIEKEVLHGDWPGEPPKGDYSASSYYKLAIDMRSKLRKRCEDKSIDPETYRSYLEHAIDIFDDLYQSLNQRTLMTEKQLKSFNSFWRHLQPDEGGYDKPFQQPWPIDELNLKENVYRYLELPVMWTDELDIAITDALIYNIMYFFIKEANTILHPRLLKKVFPYITLKGLSYLLRCAYLLSSLTITLLAPALGLGLLVAYFLINFILSNIGKRKLFSHKNVAKVRLLYLSVASVYNPSEVRRQIRNFVDDTNLIGLFPGELFDLLDKQIIQNERRWRDKAEMGEPGIF